MARQDGLDVELEVALERSDLCGKGHLDSIEPKPLPEALSEKASKGKSSARHLMTK